MSNSKRRRKNRKKKLKKQQGVFDTENKKKEKTGNAIEKRDRDVHVQTPQSAKG